MIPYKFLDAWIPKILIAMDKETHHAILNLGYSVSLSYLKSYMICICLILKTWKHALQIIYLLMIKLKKHLEELIMLWLNYI
jgi:hypothetical protein